MGYKVERFLDKRKVGTSVQSLVYDCIMLLGHVATFDDSILESGNHETKLSKAIVFRGGTAKANAFFTQVRGIQVDGDGNETAVTRQMRANVSVEAQLLINKYLKQYLQLRRKTGAERSITARRA